MLLAETLDNFSSFPQVVPGHHWKQVVLNLMIQATVPKVGNEARFNIAGGKHLGVQKIHGIIFIDGQHPLVVGGEDNTVVEAEQGLMDQNKG